MATGLLALLDDVAALVKASAVSVDDISAQVAKTSSKVSGIIIDDAAVTPKYVVGLDPSRELSIIYNIARKSLLNKLVFLAPAALALGFFMPWLITPILMLGGCYLCFEGYEKVHSIFSAHDHASHEEDVEAITPAELETLRIDSAVRTDFILSAEIIAITYATVATSPLFNQIIVMAIVATCITVTVYGFVGLIVKMDDIGLHLTKEKYRPVIRTCGRGLVKSMPHFLKILSYIGTAAMLWVGAEIIVHGIPPLHHSLDSLQHALAFSPVFAWVAKAGICALGGIMLGAVVAKLVTFIQKIRTKQ
jgi:predicted DNA repair protein MutK